MGVCCNKLVGTGVVVWHSHAVLLKSDSAEGSGSDIEAKIEDLELDFPEEGSSNSADRDDDEQTTIHHTYFADEATTEKENESSSMTIPDDASESTCPPMCRPLPSGHIVQVSRQVDDGASTVFTRASKYDEKDKYYNSAAQFLGDGLNELFLACRTGDAGVIRRLRQTYGSTLDVNKLTGGDKSQATAQRHGYQGYGTEDFTPLILASEKNHAAVVQELLNFEKIEINKTNNWDESSLFVACRQGHPSILKLLIAHPEIQINKANTIYYTPLKTAISYGHVECVRLLLKHPEIDVDQKDMVDFAREAKHKKIVKMLKKHGGKSGKMCIIA